jgi:CBS domain-containing protein
MAQTVRDVMTTDPITLPKTAPVGEAARLMKEQDIGDVIVLDDGNVCGIVTDRDLVVRTLAEGRDPDATKVGEVCSSDPVTLPPDAEVSDAVKIMRQNALRRLPITDDGRPVGVVSLGDLAVEQDPNSALADISEAPPND